MQKLLNRFKTVPAVLIFLLEAFIPLWGQTPTSDLILLRNRELIPDCAYPTRTFMVDKTTKPVIRYNPIMLLAGGAMFVYQNAISSQFSADCLYRPSCSEYSKRLINRFGLFKGIFCTADRLTRCNRISALGIMPVEIDDKTHHISESTNYYRWREN
jgi:uncharacterized protein